MISRISVLRSSPFFLPFLFPFLQEVGSNCVRNRAVSRHGGDYERNIAGHRFAFTSHCHRRVPQKVGKIRDAAEYRLPPLFWIAFACRDLALKRELIELTDDRLSNPKQRRILTRLSTLTFFFFFSRSKTVRTVNTDACEANNVDQRRSRRNQREKLGLTSTRSRWNIHEDVPRSNIAYCTVFIIDSVLIRTPLSTSSWQRHSAPGAILSVSSRTIPTVYDLCSLGNRRCSSTSFYIPRDGHVWLS